MITQNKPTEARLQAFQKNLLRVLQGNKDKVDLEAYDVVLIPILERNHFYLICFDFRKPSIQVIDNMHPKASCVSLKDNPRYISKGTPYKVVS